MMSNELKWKERVRANVGGNWCTWSPWSYFKFTI